MELIEPLWSESRKKNVESEFHGNQKLYFKRSEKSHFVPQLAVLFLNKVTSKSYD
jgi:hypothetical protein